MRVVELDLAGPLDFEPAQFVQWQGLRPETERRAIGVERHVDVHGLCLSTVSEIDLAEKLDTQR